MISKNSNYKGQDLLSDSYLSRMQNFFNPYEYNFESSLKDQINQDKIVMKSKEHQERRGKK